MDDFGILARDFGFKPQGKSAPMKSDTRPSPPATSSSSDIDYDSIFKNTDGKSKSVNFNSTLPVYDKPVYDDFDDGAGGGDIFDGLPGVKSKSMGNSTSARFYEDDNIFASMSSNVESKKSDGFDDLLSNLGRKETVKENKPTKSSVGFDDLLPGFGSGGNGSR
ncbi:hypothetical protein Tco_1536868, partial [Tanacetum coccineum]